MCTAGIEWRSENNFVPEPFPSLSCGIQGLDSDRLVFIALGHSQPPQHPILLFSLHLRWFCYIAQAGLKLRVVMLWLLSAETESVRHQPRWDPALPRHGIVASIFLPLIIGMACHALGCLVGPAHQFTRLELIPQVIAGPSAFSSSYKHAESLSEQRTHLLSLNTRMVYEQLKGKAYTILESYRTLWTITMRNKVSETIQQSLFEISSSTVT